MELKELFEQLMGKVTEKDDIELVATIKNKVDDVTSQYDADLQDALGQITHYKDLYKKSVLQGGFTTEVKEDVVTPKAPLSFEEQLQEFINKENN